MPSHSVKLMKTDRLLDIKHSIEETPDSISGIGTIHLWKQGYKGKGVVVAVLDTGCDNSHSDLKERVIGGRNFTDEFNGEVTNFGDLNGHGTHVAGIIAAASNNYGIVGVAPEANLLILKVLDQHGNGTVEALVDAINYAVNWRGPKNERVDIITMSLGLRKANEELHQAIKTAISNNIAVVAAAGNEGDGDLNTIEYAYPASYEEVIAVGAIDNNKDIAKFTNSNKEIDIYAPGVSIISTYPNDEFMYLTGTSMATPHVTGALALLINKFESLNKSNPTEQQLFKYLMEHSTKVQLINNQGTISVLNLAQDLQIEVKNTDIDVTLLMKCFCEARKSQAFFTKCMNESSNEIERNFLINLIQDSASKADYIKSLCSPFEQ